MFDVQLKVDRDRDGELRLTGEWDANVWARSVVEFPANAIVIAGTNRDELLRTFRHTFDSELRIIDSRAKLFELGPKLNNTKLAKSILVSGAQLEAIESLDARLGPEAILSKLIGLGAIDPGELTEIDSAIDDVVDAIAGKVVVIDLPLFRGTLFGQLVPAIIQRAGSSKLIFLAGDGPVRRLKLPTFVQPRVPLEKLFSVVEQFSRLPGNAIDKLYDVWCEYADIRYVGELPVDLAQSFFDFVVNPSDIELWRVPPQEPAPIRVALKGGVFEVDDNAADAKTDVIDGDVISELCEQIEDVAQSAYLSNCAPGIARKLERMKGHLRVAAEGNLTRGGVVRIGMLNGALRSVLESEKDDMPPHAAFECRSLFVQIDLFLAQFSEWEQYVRNGVDRDWGRIISAEYVAGLSRALDEFGASESTGETLKSEIESLNAEVSNLAADHPIAIGATSSVKNLLAALASRVVGGFIRMGGEVYKKVAAAAADHLFDAALKLAKRIVPIMMALSKQNPQYFGWLENFAGFLAGLQE